MKRYYWLIGPLNNDVVMKLPYAPSSAVQRKDVESQKKLAVYEFDPATMFPTEPTETAIAYVDQALESFGMIALEDQDDAPVLPLALRQAPVPAQLTSAGAAIPNLSGWQTVVEQEIAVGAGAKIEIDWWIFGNMVALLLGGQVRVVANGGSYTNYVVQAALDLPLVVTGAHLAGPALFTPNAAGTYTLALQAQATISLGTFTPQAGCAIRLKEFGVQL